MSDRCSPFLPAHIQQMCIARCQNIITIPSKCELQIVRQMNRTVDEYIQKQFLLYIYKIVRGVGAERVGSEVRCRDDQHHTILLYFVFRF